MNKKNQELIEEELEINLLDLLNVVFKRWKLIAKICFVVVFLTVVYSLVKTPLYTAEVTILPPSESGISGSLSQLKSVAAQFGLAQGESNLDSPLMYRKVLESRELINRVVQLKYPSPGDKEKKTLIEIYGLSNEGSTEKRLYSAYKKLLKSMKIKIDNSSMTLTLSIEATDPQLAADIANVMIEELDKINQEIRTAKAKSNKEFIEGRLEDTKKRLRSAEEALKIFREKNRRIEDSPELLIQQGRLKREIELQQEVFITLTREYELAKIQEVKDTPQIYTLSKAKPPVEKSSPKRKKNVLVSFFLAIFLGIIAAFVLEYKENNKKELNELEGFKIFLNDFHRFFHKFRRSFHRKGKRHH